MKEKSEIRHMVDGWSGPSIGRIPPLPQRMPAWYWFKKKELRSPPSLFEKNICMIITKYGKLIKMVFPILCNFPAWLLSCGNWLAYFYQ